LIRIAPSSYAPATPVIPALGAAVVAYGLFVAVYRGSRFPHKRTIYVTVAVLSAVAFLLVTPPLIARFGLYGAPAGQILVFVVAVVSLLVLSQRGPHPLSFSYPRIVGTLLLAGACLLAVREAGRLPLSWEVVLVTAILALFPALAFATRLVPRRHSSQIWDIARSLPASQVRKTVAVRFEELGRIEKNELELLVRDRASASRIAELVGRREDVILHRFVSYLRGLGRVGVPSENDAAIGAYLLSRAPTAERDSRMRELRREGVDPLELHALEVTCERLRQLTPRAWMTAGTGSSRGPSAAPSEGETFANG
jgi:hypothetical protein